jgi:outer membrane lipase/esterase
MINFKKELLALTAASSMLVTGAANANITSMVSFGDSLSDSGNVHAMLGNFTAPYAGLNSNGPVWTGHLSQSLGLGPHTGSLTGGTAWGHAGARASIATNLVDPGVLGAGHPGVPNMPVQTQVNNYLASNGGSANPDTLYTLWGGANDALYAAATFDYAAVPAAASDIANMADQLMDAGATSVLIMNLPNIGYTPRQNHDPADAAGGDFISVQYNNALSGYVDAIKDGRDIQIFDAYTWTSDLVNNLPAGMNGTDACIVDAELAAANGQSPGMCSDPENYLWWDAIHPTTVGHQLLADSVLPVVQGLDVATVPVPAAAWLFLSGVAGLAGIRKVRK